MKKSIGYISILLFALAACTSKSPDFIVACGLDEVFIANISQDVPQKVWSWTGESSDGLPTYMRNKFLTTDECKPVDKGKQILITSSGGGVALVDRFTGSTLFYATVPNAQSAEMLPANLLVAAASFSMEGNRLNLYCIDNSDVVMYSDSLYGAHGLYWDDKSELLWALGTEELRSYSIFHNNELPKLKIESSLALPDTDGHDLVPTVIKGIICLSTANNVWLFDTESEAFSLHPTLGDEDAVKSISYNSISEEIAYVKATENTWLAYYIRFAGSKKVIHFPGEKIYKARWLFN